MTSYTCNLTRSIPVTITIDRDILVQLMKKPTFTCILPIDQCYKLSECIDLEQSECTLKIDSYALHRILHFHYFRNYIDNPTLTLIYKQMWKGDALTLKLRSPNNDIPWSSNEDQPLNTVREDIPWGT